MIDWAVRHAICGLSELPGHGSAGVTHLLSLLDPETLEPAPFDPPPRRRLTLRFHDVIAPEPGLIPPSAEDVAALLDFGRSLGDASPEYLLVHCHMGVSRSTAAMAALLASAHPEAAEEEVFDQVLRLRPQAWPNSRIVALADEALGRRGRLLAALGRLYARQLAANPRFAEGLRNAGRGAEVDLAEAFKK
jgi:predicted protein tyrosine phosphatase